MATSQIAMVTIIASSVNPLSRVRYVGIQNSIAFHGKTPEKPWRYNNTRDLFFSSDGNSENLIL